MDAQEYTKRAQLIERGLRECKRNILTIKDVVVSSVPGDVDLFEAHFQSAQGFWHQFLKAYAEREELAIEAGKEDFPTDSWVASYDSLHQEIIKADGRLRTLRRGLQASQPPNEPPSPINNAMLNLTSGTSRPHLPEIPVPSFNGDLLKWTNFRDTFVSLIHDDPTLSSVQKFHYLIGALKGEAASLIKNFPVDDRSYEQAWTKVKNTYNNPRVLASLLVQRILDCNIGSCRNELQKYELFLTNIADSVEAFRALRLENPAEFLLASLALRALDPATRRHFEFSLGSTSDLPTVDKIIDFVRQRKLALKMSQDLGVKTSSPSQSSSSKRHSGVSFHLSDSSSRNGFYQSSVHKSPSPQSYYGSPKQRQSPSNKSFNPICANCKGDHPILRCQSFQRSPLQERIKVVKKRNLCFNCLSRGHDVSTCRSRFRCRECGKKHHSIIHGCPEGDPAAVNQDRQTHTAQPETFTGLGTDMSFPSSNTTVLLRTVQLLVKGPHGKTHSARALLDTGSHRTFISAPLAQKIGAKVQPYAAHFNSLCESAIPSSHFKGITICHLSPHSREKEFRISPIVVDKIISALPSQNLPRSTVQRLWKDSLADPQFHTPAPIDLLIGQNLYDKLITGLPYPTGVEDLSYIPTIFGTVIAGELQNEASSQPMMSLFLDCQSTLQSQLNAFWELEEPSPVDRSHPDDIYCEEHFRQTHSRTKEGRYIVRLPFNSDLPELGTNKEVVLRRFYALEAKFRKDRSFSERYHDFMREYSDLLHMSPTTDLAAYLIPHHGVWQEHPQGRKLRVVFDASCPSSGKSLNDVLYAGPKLQEDICMILIRFRLYVVAICADLVKMYRQVLIHPCDRRYQHILWREDSSSAIQEVELNTVTYGIKSSAFHALRVIRQLVHDEGEHFPLAAAKIPREMYVDDIVSGANSIQEASRLIEELTALFAKGGFSLSKWASNIPSLLPSSSSNEKVNIASITPPADHFVKILGLYWNPSSDAFSYTTRTPPSQGVTKRIMLSSVARIFDPLGLLTPITFSAKSLIQDVWKRNLDWDDYLPEDLKSSWELLSSDWSILGTISLPRYISDVGASLQLIGFCDASSKGYAAALYLRSESPSGEVKVSLIKAKSKVAPLRFHSIARLELCGALLLSRIVSSVSLPTSRETICFTDSEVVLSWLRTPTYELKVFEANRVAQILNIVPLDFWRHVSSEENPADIASRGSTPIQLKSDLLWWSGPPWLQRSLDHWFQASPLATVLTAVLSPKPAETAEDWTLRFSSFITLIRATAYMLRFSNLLRSRIKGTSIITSGPITAAEFLEAELRCAAFVQTCYLPRALYGSKTALPHDFAKLQPFVDERGLIRVGGRLQESSLPEDHKYPILIPYEAHFSKLVVDYIHCSNFHAGATLCLSLLRSKYWIPRATRMIRGRILRCVRCRLLKAKPRTPVMAPLPKGRFQQGRPFTQVGVDFAGPFLIKESRRRNAALGKSYLCLFVCFASKALHLELVSSLSTTAFLAALDRFIARRGAPSVIWSDHGSNFLGASKFLKQVIRQHREDDDSIQRHLSPRGVEWKFIPPRAPHFGGLWEAGVKSVKSLLTSIVGKQPYNFEELSTILAKIEGLLNSRPLCPLTEDVNDMDYLTPGHFLLGAPPTSLPNSSESPCGPSSLITRWSLLKEQIRHVWSRWSKDYLHTLQQRAKWTRSEPGLKTGDLVILLERRLTVGQWPVARVINVFPGRDGITRTVIVRTPSGGLLTRASTSLAPLFLPEED